MEFTNKELELLSKWFEASLELEAHKGRFLLKSDYDLSKKISEELTADVVEVKKNKMDKTDIYINGNLHGSQG
jgi:hypothetical protein